MAPLDEPPSPSAELLEEKVAALPRTGLPRLSIVHFMAWMAATALAFVPYQMQLKATERLSPGATAMTSTAVGTSASLVYGVAAGSYLFVTAAVAYWRRRGRRFRLQPGHWLAIEGVADWGASMATWLMMFSMAGGPDPIRMMFPRAVVGLIFFFCFLWLAIRRDEPLIWRLTFAAFALAPIAGWLANFAVAFAGGRMVGMMMSHAGVHGAQGLVLALAMAADLRNRGQRHWSHWLGGGMALLLLVGLAALYAYYWLFPGAIMAA